MQFNITLGKVGVLLLVWAFFAALAHIGVNIPTGLLALGSILYLVG